MAASSNGIKNSFSNTPQAKDDAFVNPALTEDAIGTFVFDVMANDAGGKAKNLYSVDSGSDQNRLLASDTARSDAATSDTSALGAKVWITADNKVGYRLTDAVSQKLQTLGAGETLVDSFTYAIQLGNGTLSWATATVRIVGINDVAVVNGEATGSVSEDSAALLNISGQLTISDADRGQSSFVAQSDVVGSYGKFSINAAGNWTYSADNTQAAIQQLGAGQSLTESFVVSSFDGSATKTVIVTITGTNDVPVIGGTTAASLNEDTAATLVATGTLTIADVDQNQSSFISQAATAGQYGIFNVDTTGNWTYNADNSQTAIQQLGAGQALTESFTVVSLDGSASQTVTVTINGTNDLAVIDGIASASVSEDAAGALNVSGTLTIADADQNQSAFVAQTGIAGAYGSFSIDTSGKWTYSADNSQIAVQQLGAGESLSETFVVSSFDGSATQAVTVTITGTNDVPVIDGAAAASVSEDAGATLDVGGALTIADADQNQSSFIYQAATAGQYGTFNVDTAGNWTYSTENGQAAIQQLGAGQALTESFTVVSLDGSANQTVTVTINGTNDLPVIGGVASASVSEDAAAALNVGGILTVADADQNQSAFVAQTGIAGAYGSFSIDTSGNWTYSADNSQIAVQQLGTGQSLTESFSLSSFDGSATQTVTVTITGTNDVPVIGGTTAASLNEDTAATLVAAGTLTIADADQNQSSFIAQATTAGQYGIFNVDTAGNWTYSAENGQAAIQQLGAGQALTESFTVVSLDGSANQTVTVTINGTNDLPVIGGVASASVSEDAAAALNVGGILTVADADQNQSSFVAQAGIAGAYGSFSIDTSGNWTYSAANNQIAVQQLAVGQSLTEIFTLASFDGTVSQDVTVVINGVNDIATISGVSAGIVSEDGVTTAAGALTIADADLGQAAFAAQNGVAGTFGSFSINAAGNWNYSANNSLAVIQQLGAGQSLTDSFNVLSLDGSASEIVKVTLNGANDAAVIGLPTAASVTEDANVVGGKLVATGIVSIADADLGQNQFQTAVTPASGTLGTLTLAANGSYTYSVANSAVQGLKGNESKIDTFTIRSIDGTAKDISFTIKGADEAVRVQPRILFVDDDGGVTSNVTWTTTLQSLGYTYDVQTLALNGNPTNLQNYDMVIWSVSDRAYTNLTAQNVSTLTTYLNGGGDLLYAGGHNLYDETPAISFIQNYLGLSNFQYNMPSVNSQAHLHASGPGGSSYTLSDFSDNPGFTSVYNGDMMSAFHTAKPSARMLMEITSGGAHAGHSGSASYDTANNDIAAINYGSNYRAATMGFDLNQLDPQFRAGFLDQVVQLVGGSPWNTVFQL